MKTLLTATLSVLLFAGSAAMADSHHDRGRDGGSRHGNSQQHHSNNNYRDGSRDGGRRDWSRREGREHFDRSFRDQRSRGNHQWDNRLRDNRLRDNRHRDNRHWNDGRRWHDTPRWNSYRPAFGYRSQRWHRGAHLPVAYFSSRYVIYDYGAYRVRRPPRGYHWIRVNSDLLLVAIATGLVVDIVAGY